MGESEYIAMKLHLSILILAIGQAAVDSLDCGEHTITPGESYPILSPNYPDKYGEEDSCKWEITCDDSAGVIGISCDEFKTEEDDPCEDADFLKVSDSTGTIDYFCGKSGPDLVSADDKLKLKFNTDGDSKVKSGFSCTVVCTVEAESTTTQGPTTTEEPEEADPTSTEEPEEADPTTTEEPEESGPLECGEHTITPGKSYPIESPNYPDKYGEKDSCKWEFTCDDSAGVIGISCDEFKTEEDDPCKDADFIKVSDGTGTIDYFCGKSGPDLESADNILKVKFNTDGDSKVKSGFSCSVVCTVKLTTPDSAETTAELTTSSGYLDCGEYTITPGETYPIASPNYPDKYGEKDQCKWEFTCDNSAGVIGVSCDDFKTEEDDPCNDGDFLKVADSTGTIDYFCGKSGPDLESEDNSLILKFNTDGDSEVKRGFSCSIVCTVKPTTTADPATTTADPATTTADPATTEEGQEVTPEGGWSGNCSNSITASAGMKIYWETPNYDGQTHYPHGDYCCSLNITIPDTYNMFMVNMEMIDDAVIYETSQCIHDNIQYTSSHGHTSTLCGNLAGQSWSEIAVYNTPLYFSFTWCSTHLDGYKTDIGFRMQVTGIDTSIL